MAWQLDTEQAQRLQAIAKRRDLQRLGGALSGALPGVQARIGARYDEFIAIGAQRGTAHGLSHLACLGRYIACWVVLGSDFETRYPWAGALLADPTCSEGAKAFQLCVRTAEQLGLAPQAGQLGTVEFNQALQHLDAVLLAAGVLGSLLPRECIRLGSPCDLDAVELSVLGDTVPQYYTARDGLWSRVAREAKRKPVRLSAGDARARAAPDAGAAVGPAAPSLPPLLNLLCPCSGGEPARVRLRTRAQSCCDAQVHPWLTVQTPQGAGEWRGAQTRELVLCVQTDAPAVPQGGALSPIMAWQSPPQYSRLSLCTCGLRASGASVGNLSTQIAAYADEQHLLAWRREPPAPMSWPEGSAPSGPPTPRLRLERDGAAIDASRWQAGFAELDHRLLAGLSRLAVAWERESGVTQARVHSEPRVMCGDAGITWGWAEGPSGMSSLPFHRVAGQMDLVACQLDLRFSGVLALEGSSSRLLLSCAASEPLKAVWERISGDADLVELLQPAQTSFSQPFSLALESMAQADATMLGVAGPVQGALVGHCGLRTRADGAGLQWFASLHIEAVSVMLHWHDPLLGQQELQRPLLPAMKLLDWSLG